MVKFGNGIISITFGDYGNEAHMEIAEEIQVHLEQYKEDKDYFLYLRRGDDVASGMDLYNLRLLEDIKLRTLLNIFV
tara:strand:- start:210 stop:440 length:231 start_codon:yes stop_codon:yes gene_type:complete